MTALQRTPAEQYKRAGDCPENDRESKLNWGGGWLGRGDGGGKGGMWMVWGGGEGGSWRGGR